MKPSELDCLILASGLGRRFSGGDKLLAPFRGAPVAQHVARTALSIGFSHVLAVCGEGQSMRQKLFHDLGIEVVNNPDPVRGQGHSISVGIRALSQETTKGVVILLADMPEVRASDLGHLCDALDPTVDAVVSVYGALRQPPVAFHPRVKPELMVLDGDHGARVLLQRLNIRTVAVSEASGSDIDTVEDLVRHQNVEAEPWPSH